jgi:hypothetical protein
MIGTIRRHQQWLWAIIIGATIVSFVYYLAPSNRNGMSRGDSGTYYLGSIFGNPITVQQMRDAKQEARLLLRRNTGQWPDGTREKELEQIARQELLLNAELDEFHIVATPEAAARYTKRLIGIDPDTAVPANKIVETLNQLVQDGGISMEDFDRFVRHQVGQEYLVALVGMSGKLITPKEAEVFYRRENEPIQSELVSFPASAYYSKTKPTAAEIEDYYTKRQADYRIPDRIQVNYIEFPLTNYAAEAMKQLGTNLNEAIDQEYVSKGAAAFKDEKGTQLSEAEAKDRMKKAFLRYGEMGQARKDAYTFLNALAKGHDEQHPYAVEDLGKLAKEKNLVVKTSEPFDPQTPSAELPVSDKNLRILFSLRDDDPEDKDKSMLYASSPLEGTNGYYVVGLARRIPSQVQPLSAVRDKVIADYMQGMALEKAKDAGKRFESELQAGMSQGKTFDTMCAAQFVHPTKLTPFTMMTQSIPELTNKVEFTQLQEMAGKMQPGQATPFMPTPDGGILFYVKARLPADDALVKQNLPAYIDRMREQLQVAAFQEWFGKEYHDHFRAPPGETPAAGG